MLIAIVIYILLKVVVLVEMLLVIVALMELWMMESRGSLQWSLELRLGRAQEILPVRNEINMSPLDMSFSAIGVLHVWRVGGGPYPTLAETMKKMKRQY